VGPDFHPAPASGQFGRERTDPPYLLCVGAWGPYKGHAEALDVISRLAALGYPHRLKIAGPQDPWMQAHLESAVASSQRADRVDILGYVAQLPELYRGAEALLMTSRHEGFGLPAVEAMACGTPVVAFANSSLVEVVGDGGTLVPDGDVEAVVAAVRPLLDHAEARARESRRALQRASAFDWRRSAAAHAAVLRDVARG
jgi:glycosyltransferase involved in cell wall biosynthesis